MNKDKNTNIVPFVLKGNWHNQSKALKENFSNLTDRDLEFEMGKEDELIDRLSNKLNKNREEVIKILSKGERINKD